MKKLLLIVLIFLSLTLLSSCVSIDTTNEVHNGDWSYKLPNNYEIWHINSREIICGKKDGEHSLFNTIEGKYVTEFCYNDRYVCLKCVNTIRDPSVEFDMSNPDFYILDTAEDKIYGPFAEEKYLEEKDNLNIKNIPNWIKTNPIPEDADFS